MLVAETDARRGAVTDFNKLLQDAPEDLHGVFQGHTAIPWYRAPEFRAVCIKKILTKLKLEDDIKKKRQLVVNCRTAPKAIDGRTSQKTH